MYALNNYYQISEDSGDVCPQPLREFKGEENVYTGKVHFSQSYTDGENIVKNMILSKPSIAWCGTNIPIKWPLEWSWSLADSQKRKTCYKYAFVVILYPDNKGNLSYLDGALGVALGLRRQGTLAELVCMITSDVKERDIRTLELVFDRIITIPYITSSHKILDNELSIEISPEIYRDCHWYKKIPDCGHAYCHVFTKLHILNLVEYEKVALVDLDIVPIRNYDSIFGINTPAGVLEYNRSEFKEHDDIFKTACSNNVKLGQLIPHKLTDIDTMTGGDINAGLLLVSPDSNEFKNIITELKKPRREWFDKQGLRFRKNKDEWEYSYCYPEQNYLTKRWSGRWHVIDWGYAMWQKDANISFGVHMAGFEGKKPWMAQSVDYLTYNQVYEKELTYIEYSIREFNKVYVWALNKYPILRRSMLRDLFFFGAYRTYVEDGCEIIPLNAQYPGLTDKETLHWSELKRGKGNDAIRKLLAPEQREIVDLLI